LIGRDVKYCAVKVNEMKEMEGFLQSRAAANDMLLEVSYLVSKKTAISDEAHTTSEILIKPQLSGCCEQC
jgi:hypothetical protein